MVGDTSIGVDLGMKRFFVTSEGKTFCDKDYLAKRRKVRHLKKVLRSKGTHSAKRHLKKIRRKERNLSKDMQHRAANMLLNSTDASIIVLEDLKKLKSNTSKTSEGYNRKRHNSAMSQVPFAEFKDILAHKAALVGRQVITVSPTWTSQTDSRSNKRDGKRQGCRYYCADGIVLDADWNAAVNIAIRGNHPISSVLPIDGRLSPLVGKAMSAAYMLGASNSKASSLLKQ
jgi:IS605 OrfB family transposase